ncbi:gluconate 2-dehydrogenase subunit 3 family protein [Frateuria defendens]|uniref:gluconate 2-dehydrogenase subunit 3 family protein n=1 Tax=Frateuria defendens TaxID=2219559 RepID=UPI00066FB383|nr:gluconate 2-dehydrogenase subunit 3 family protein [Frateuria defendens]
MSPDDTSPARRDFLRKSLTLIPAAALAGQAASGAAAAAPGHGAAAARDYQPTFFTPEEWAFLRAGVARLIPADERGPGALEAGVPEYIDRQMATPYASGSQWYMHGPFNPDAPKTMGYQLRLAPREIYRLGIRDAEAWSRKQHGKPFATLDAATQDALLAQFEQGEAQFEGVPSKVFFALLLGNTREGFFCDPVHGGNQGMVGWTLIGFPGARADFMDWVERDERYPFPPVSIRGERA